MTRERCPNFGNLSQVMLTPRRPEHTRAARFCCCLRSSRERDGVSYTRFGAARRLESEDLYWSGSLETDPKRQVRLRLVALTQRLLLQASVFSRAGRCRRKTRWTSWWRTPSTSSPADSPIGCSATASASATASGSATPSAAGATSSSSRPPPRWKRREPSTPSSSSKRRSPPPPPPSSPVGYTYAHARTHAQSPTPVRVHAPWFPHDCMFFAGTRACLSNRCFVSSASEYNYGLQKMKLCNLEHGIWRW